MWYKIDATTGELLSGPTVYAPTYTLLETDRVGQDGWQWFDTEEEAKATLIGGLALLQPHLEVLANPDLPKLLALAQGLLDNYETLNDKVVEEDALGGVAVVAEQVSAAATLEEGV